MPDDRRRPARRSGGREFERVLGRHDGLRPGPTVVVIGGIHGNEPAGALAAARVAGELPEKAPGFRGSFLALSGNRAALQQGRRYLDRDLNRRWRDEDLAALRARAQVGESVPEDLEQQVLMELIDDAIASARGAVTFLDLHSTSGEGPPFACMSDTLRNRRIARVLPIPVILGLEEVIDGTMLGYLSDLGHRGVAVEGGQHEHPDTVAQHVAAIWLVLGAAGCLRPAEVPLRERYRQRLARASAGLPEVVEIRHRHVVGPDDVFVMQPDYASFQPIEEGELVARDLDGEIRAPLRGLMLLPRYQGQGEDGYFVARRVRPAWLRLSAVLRRLRLSGLVTLVPGLRRDPARPDRVLVAGRSATRLQVNLLHLFGYRRVESRGGRLVYSRRRPGGAPRRLPRPAEPSSPREPGPGPQGPRRD